MPPRLPSSSIRMILMLLSYSGSVSTASIARAQMRVSSSVSGSSTYFSSATGGLQSVLSYNPSCSFTTAAFGHLAPVGDQAGHVHAVEVILHASAYSPSGVHEYPGRSNGDA